MAHPLDGAELRLYRADRHLTEADSIVQAFADSYIQHFVPSDDGKSARFDKWPDIPSNLAVVVSDAIHNFRSALDYLVFELALHDSGTVQNNTQFLIEDFKVDPADPKRRGFDARALNCLRGLRQDHINSIELLQPYKGVKWTKDLREVSNPDKHRRLTALTHKGQLVGVTVRHRKTGRFTGEPRLDRETNDLAFDRYDIEIDAHQTIAIEGTKTSEPAIMPILRKIQLGVHRTIDSFKPEF